MESQQQQKRTNFLPYLLIAAVATIIAGIGIFLIVTFCSVRNVSRTVMIYMVGSNLESENGLASGELAGIEHPEKVLENGIRVILIAGGSKKWDNDYISVDETSIFELKADGFEKVKTQSVRNMGDVKVFSDFVNFATENYPSDDYDIIFWNHGGAIDGSEYDELYDEDNLSLAELREGFENTIFNNGKKLEAVVFSTCLNGSLEMANLLSAHARYLVASEETSVSYPGSSDFAFLQDVDPHDDGNMFGEKFVEKYQEKTSALKKLYRAYAQKYDVYSTYSVVDLAKIPALNSAVDEFFGSIDAMENYSEISKIRAGLYQYANEQSQTPDYDMVDLYNLSEALDKFSSVKASKVTEAIEDAVVYNYATNSESRGLSIYFPYNGKTRVQEYFLGTYPKITPSESYSSFISDFNKVLVAGVGKSFDISKSKASVKNTTSTSADFTLDLTDEQAADFARGRYMVFRSNPDYPGYYWPTYISKNVDLDGNTLKAAVRGRQLMVYDADDESPHTITVIESDETDEYIRYEFGVVLEDYRPAEIKDWRTEAATIRITRDKATNEIGISDVFLNPKSDDSAKDKVISKSSTPVYVNYEDYEHVAFVSSSYNVINEDMSFNNNFESNGVIQGWEVDADKLAFTLQENFDDGNEYYCVFQVWDIYNNSTISKFVKLK